MNLSSLYIYIYGVVIVSRIVNFGLGIETDGSLIEPSRGWLSCHVLLTRKASSCYALVLCSTKNSSALARITSAHESKVKTNISERTERV